MKWLSGYTMLLQAHNITWYYGALDKNQHLNLCQRNYTVIFDSSVLLQICF